MTREEAIDIVRKNYPHVEVSGSQFETALRNLIPELRESEDERIRQGIVETIKQCTDMLDPKNQKRMLDWLEKQKEQKQKIKVRIPKFRVGDIIQHVPLERWDSSRKITSIDEHGYNYNLSHLGDTVSGGAFGFAFENEYELVEQKSAEKQDLVAQLKEHLANTPKEQLEAEWKELKKWNHVGPTVEEYLRGIKPAEWSEEDVNRAIFYTRYYQQSNGTTDGSIECDAWLKSLRPQHHQTDEDKSISKEILEYFNEKKDYRSRWYAWVKYASRNPHWKPSEEQIATLEKWLKDKQFDGASRYVYPIFESLYEQLQKLM